MEQLSGIWLMFSMGFFIAWGASKAPCPRAGEETCYQVVRRREHFLKAQKWCRWKQARLLHSWNQNTVEFLRTHLEDGVTIWVDSGSDSVCKTLVRRGVHFQARRQACSQKLIFICEWDPPQRSLQAVSTPAQPHSPQRLTSWQKKVPTITSHLAQEPRSFQPPTMTTPPNPRAETPTRTYRQWLTTQLEAGTRPLLVIKPELTTTQEEPPGHELATITPNPMDTSESTTGVDPKLNAQKDGSFFQLCSQTSTPEPGFSPQAVPPNQVPTDSTESHNQSLPPPPVSLPFTPWEDIPPEVNGQTLEEMLNHFDRHVQDLDWDPEGLEEAAEHLKDLTGTPALLSRDAQVSATNSLLSLSSQLLMDSPLLLASNGQQSSSTASRALFQCFSNLLQAMNESNGEQPQEPSVVEETLSALPLIQRGLVLGQSSASATSPMLSTILSRRSVPSLPLSSFSLRHPQALRVTFPSASALKPILGQYRKVLVRVACFAFNPFRHLDGKQVDHVAEVALTAQSEDSLRVQNLTEEIEIHLGGAAENGRPSSVTMNDTTRTLDIMVNVTSLEEALLVSVRPSTPIRLTLHLKAHLDSTSSLLNITLPRAGCQEEEAYIWVIPPENMHQGLGLYYVSVEEDPQSQGPCNLSVAIVNTGCYYWSEERQTWKTGGCQVGPRSTLHRTQCLCNHLSIFGRVFFVLPHVINLRKIGRLLSKVDRNPTGLFLLGGLLLGYGVALLWACRKQKMDVGKVKITVLTDNDPSACHPYLVQVFTGYRRGAGTSAQVILTLYGTEGRSRPRLLDHPKPPCFERGGMDAFLLTTRRSLGNLHALRLWHDNTGPNPSWFVCRVVVRDLHTGKKWYFLCDRWLASDMDDGQVDKVFVVASEKELLSFRHLFGAGLVQKLTQGHLWLSVVTCSPWSPFTRIQRLSCCLALLFCSMSINIMFWKKPHRHEQLPNTASFAVTWKELVVSVEAAVLLFPFQLLIVHIFQMVRPPGPEPSLTTTTSPRTGLLPKTMTLVTHVRQELMETLGFVYKNHLCQHGGVDMFPGSLCNIPELVAFLSDVIHSHLQHLEDPQAVPQERPYDLHRYLCLVAKDLEAQLRSLDWAILPSPYEHLHAIDQLCKLRQRLEQLQPLPLLPSAVEEETRLPLCCGRFRHPRTSVLQKRFPIKEPTEGRPAPPLLCCPLPSQFGFICWAVLASLILTSAFVTVLYSLRMNRDQAGHWAVTILLSTLYNLFLVQPLKVLALTGLFSLMRRKTWEDNGQEQQLCQLLGLLAEKQPCPAALVSRTWAAPMYRPPLLKPSVQPKGRALKEKKLYSLIREIAVRLAFLVVLMVLSYTERSPSEFYLNDSLQKSLAYRLDYIYTPRHLYKWARDVLVPTVYTDSRELAMDGNSVLVGSIRLRQIRTTMVPPSKPWPFVLRHPDMENKSVPSWGPSSGQGGANSSIWTYQSESALQGYPIWGKLALYPGGGYVADLGTNASNAVRVLQYLRRNKWLDRDTQAIFVEFVVYNVNINLFCVVTLILESNGLGAFQNKADLQVLRLHPIANTATQMACAQIAFLLFLSYYILVQGQRLRQQKCGYFRSKGNLLDISTVLIGVAAVGLYVERKLLAESILGRYRQDRQRFISFYKMVEVDSAVTYLIAFLLALTTVKLWNLLRLSPRMYLITWTLQKAWDEVVGFLLVLLLLLAGYSIVCNLLFGWSIYDYRTFSNSAVTIVALLIGIFDYEEILTLNPVLGFILIGTGVVSMSFVILNLFVSVLLRVFGREMKAAKDSKEESMVQLIQLKLSLLLGIKQPVRPAATNGSDEGQE